MMVDERSGDQSDQIHPLETPEPNNIVIHPTAIKRFQDKGKVARGKVTKVSRIQPLRTMKVMHVNATISP